MEEKHNVIIWCCQEKVLSLTLEYLDKKNVHSQLIVGGSECLERVIDEKPTILYISWNLYGVDVKRLAQSLPKVLDCPVYVFLENREDSRQISQFCAANITRKIASDLSGAVILNHIRSAGDNEDSVVLSSEEKASVFEINVEADKKESPLSANISEYIVDYGDLYKEVHLSRPVVAGEQVNEMMAAGVLNVSEKLFQAKNCIPKKLGHQDQVGVVEVSTSEHKGYILLAHQDLYKEGNRILENLSRVLRQEISGDGLHFGGDIQLQMNFGEDFLNWAEANAQFIILAQDKENEVGFAFVSGEKAVPDIEAVDHQDMAAIDMEYFTGGKSVSFDLFLSFPANQKFIKYIHEGEMFEGFRKDRLERKSVKKMHIRQEDVETFKKYYASQYLKSNLKNS